jgi:osmotically inducible protein OsmC
MPTRKAHARWEGSLREGKGEVDFGNRLFREAYSFPSRFEDGKGTNPEELLGAAHAGCFAMALSLILGKAGFKPEYVDVTAYVIVSPQDGGFKITGSHIVREARCPASTRRRLRAPRRKPEGGCPVSQLSPAPGLLSMPSSLQINREASRSGHDSGQAHL